MSNMGTHYILKHQIYAVILRSANVDLEVV
jgi:hypothetical protein